MTAPRCICLDKPYLRFQGDSPTRYPELIVDAHDDEFPATWRVHCSLSGSHWLVAQVPYGGIYGDFDWDRVA